MSRMCLFLYCGHKLNKTALRRQAQTSTIEEARPPACDLLTTHGRQLSPRSSMLRRGSSSSRLGWHLAPGIHHLVAIAGKKKERVKGVAKQP